MFRAFLDQAGWGGALVAPLAADYSTRVFARVTLGARTAIAMKAAPDQKTREFLAIDDMLRACGLSAPEIYAADPENGFVLMEDFGEAGTFGGALDAGGDADTLYARATDVLAELHTRFAPPEVCGLPLFNASLFTEQAGLYLDYYVPHVFGQPASDEERAAFSETMLGALSFIDSLPRTLLLRDYMLDNLMEAPGRQGVASVGLLDFQDGGLGPAAYDLASLAESVRRDVGIERLEWVLARYAENVQGVDLADLRRAALFLSAQRHTRILGIFAHYSKEEPLARATRYVARLLEEKELAPFAKIVRLKA